MSEGYENRLEHIRVMLEQTSTVLQLMEQLEDVRKSMKALEHRMDSGQKELRGEVADLRGDVAELRAGQDAIRVEMASMRDDFTRRFDLQRDEMRQVRTTIGQLLGNVETEFAGMEARMERRSLVRRIEFDGIVSERIGPLEERVEALEKQVREREAG